MGMRVEDGGPQPRKFLAAHSFRGSGHALEYTPTVQEGFGSGRLQ